MKGRKMISLCFFGKIVGICYCLGGHDLLFVQLLGFVVYL